MIIDSLYLKHFGKFHDKKITLHDNINIIYGENEAGKSTIHTFIKGMLFGIDKQRGRVNLDTYSKYQPWESPTLYNGEMEITVDGITYIIKRNFYKEEKSLVILNKETGREVPYQEKKGSCFIEGVTESNYSNTVYVGQCKVATNQELASRINDYITNMSTTQSSEVNVTEALKELQTRKKEIDAKQTKQKIRELNTELQEIQNTDFMLKELERQILGLDQEMGRIQKEKLNCKVEPTLLQKLQVLDSYVKEYQVIKEKYRNLVDLRAYYGQLKQQISLLTQNLQEKSEEEKLRQELEEQQKKLTKQTEDEKSTNKTSKHLFFYRCLICLLALLGGVGFIIPITSSIKNVVSVIFLIGACILFIKLEITKNIEKRDNNEHYVSSISKEYTIDEPGHNGNIEKNKENLRKLLYEYQETSSKLLDRMHIQEEEIKDYGNKILTMSSVDEASMQSLQHEIDEIGMQLNKQKDSISKKQERENQIIKQIETLQVKKERLSWEFSKLNESVSDYAKKRAIRDELVTRLDKEEMEQTAIELSIQTIQELATAIHDDFGHKLNHEISRMSNVFTNGSCCDIKVDEKLEMKIVKDQEYILMNYLSTGTMEQLYLALRLVAADLLLKDKNLPLILDDAFAYYDDNRLAQTLCELAKSTDRQILIFTCHNREAQILDQHQIPYHVIRCGEDEK